MELTADLLKTSDKMPLYMFMHTTKQKSGKYIILPLCPPHPLKITPLLSSDINYHPSVTQLSDYINL